VPRYFKIADPVDLLDNGPQRTHAETIEHVLDTCKAFNTTAKGARVAITILDAIRHPKHGWVLLDEADWTMLRDALEAPEAGYAPAMTVTVNGQTAPFVLPSRKFVPHVDAVSTATTKAPDDPCAHEAPANGAAAASEGALS